MAKIHRLDWETRADCLEAFASAYGEYPPAGEVPAWWKEFEKWYQEKQRDARDGVVSMDLRTETRPYEDEEEEEDDDGEEEGDPEDEDEP